MEVCYSTMFSICLMLILLSVGEASDIPKSKGSGLQKDGEKGKPQEQPGGADNVQFEAKSIGESTPKARMLRTGGAESNFHPAGNDSSSCTLIASLPKLFILQIYLFVLYNLFHHLLN